jgi:hypothetical protein
MLALAVKSGVKCTKKAERAHLTAAGSGRRVGETCEQTWAELKPLTTVTRYMSKGHYLDCIDDAFFYLTLRKQRGFVLFMVQQHKNATKKLGECSAA